MNDNVAIEAQGLTKVYGSGHTEVVAMRDATVRVLAGRCVALLGPSGAGKSTFLTAIGLINLPTSGRIFIAGRLVVDGPRARIDPRSFRRRHIGYVTQKANLIGFLSARENVELPVLLNGSTARAARTRAVELLDDLGVGARSHGYPPELSGGEQQRVAIARALANGPAVLLADEPTGNLDAATAATVFAQLKNLVGSAGLAAVIATHNEALAAQMYRIVRLHDGVLVEE